MLVCFTISKIKIVVNNRAHNLFFWLFWPIARFSGGPSQYPPGYYPSGAPPPGPHHTNMPPSSQPMGPPQTSSPQTSQAPPTPSSGPQNNPGTYGYFPADICSSKLWAFHYHRAIACLPKHFSQWSSNYHFVICEISDFSSFLIPWYNGSLRVYWFPILGWQVNSDVWQVPHNNNHPLNLAHPTPTRPDKTSSLLTVDLVSYC